MIRAPMRITPPRSPLTDLLTEIAFNPRSEQLLAGVDPVLAELMRRTEARMPDAFEISEGMRTPERQREMVATGKSQTQNSRHLTGKAVDIMAEGPGGQPNWDFEAYRPIAATAKAEAAAMGIPDFVWGGDWRTLKDGVHFQVGGPAAGGAPDPAPALSFGGIQPTPQGLAAMFGNEGLSMGEPVLPDPMAKPPVAMELAQARRQSADIARRRALASLIVG